MAFSLDKAKQLREKKLAGEWHKGTRTGVEFLVVPRFHPEVKQRAHAVERQVRQKYGLIGRFAGDGLDTKPGAVEEFVERLYSEVIVRDWRGVEEGDKEVKYSPAAMVAALRVSESVAADVSDILSLVSEEEEQGRETVSGN